MTASVYTADKTVTRDRQLGGQQNATRSSSTTTTAHGAGRTLNPVDLEAIRSGYVDILGQLNAIKARDIERAITCGLEASAILDALEQVALAPRPSHAYFRAVLGRYISQGIFTGQDAERDREEFRARREAANRERAAWYADPADSMPW